MRLLRRTMAAALGLAGAVGLALCVAAVVGCWVAYAEAVRRVDRTFDRAAGSLGGVRDDLTQVGDRLRETRGELDAIRRREADLAAQPPEERSHRRLISRKAAEGGPPQLTEARQKLVKATEAALVLEGLLDVLAELPLGERVGVEPGPLRDASDRLGELIGRSEQLAATLAKASPNPADGAAEESTRLSEGLDRIVAAADAGAGRADGAHDRVRAWHARLVRWLTVTAVAVTLLLTWIGLGQLSLLAHGYTWAPPPAGAACRMRIGQANVRPKTGARTRS